VLSHVAFGGRGYNLALELTKTIVEDYGKEVVLLLSSQNTNQQVPGTLTSFALFGLY
jgi:hypothetical protein